MANLEAHPGIGPTQWNAGAWFGSVIGGSAWMLVTACFLASGGQLNVALVPAAAFVVVNLVAWALWIRRRHVAPFPALMSILGLMAVAMPMVWSIVTNWASVENLRRMNWPDSQFWTLFVALMVPVVMAGVGLMEYRSRIRDAR